MPSSSLPAEATESSDTFNPSSDTAQAEPAAHTSAIFETGQHHDHSDQKFPLSETESQLSSQTEGSEQSHEEDMDRDAGEEAKDYDGQEDQVGETQHEDDDGMDLDEQES